MKNLIPLFLFLFSVNIYAQNNVTITNVEVFDSENLKVSVTVNIENNIINQLWEVVLLSGKNSQITEIMLPPESEITGGTATYMYFIVPKIFNCWTPGIITHNIYSYPSETDLRNLQLGQQFCRTHS